MSQSIFGNPDVIVVGAGNAAACAALAARESGGHVIMLGPGNEEAAKAALRAYPGGLQVGGGITPAHADQYYWPLASDRTITAWIPLQEVQLEMGPLGFYAGSQGVSFGRDLGISDESEARITENMARHGFPFEVGAFDLGEVSFHLGWTFHKAGANTSTQPRSVMTVIYMDADMRLVPALNAIQANDRDQWCPGALEGEIIDTRKNPLVWAR